MLEPAGPNHSLPAGRGGGHRGPAPLRPVGLAAGLAAVVVLTLVPGYGAPPAVPGAKGDLLLVLVLVLVLVALAAGAPRGAGESGAGREVTLPGGVVTFLFTDVEGSTRLLEAHPRAYRDALVRHHTLLRLVVDGHGGVVFETIGDAVYAAFDSPAGAARAALEGQLRLQQETPAGAGVLRVRMALHCGEVEVQGAHYFGAPLYRCARLMALARGGQVLLSGAVATLLRDAPLPDGASLCDLGLHRLKDLRRAERVHRLVHPGLAGPVRLVSSGAPGASPGPVTHRVAARCTVSAGGLATWHTAATPDRGYRAGGERQALPPPRSGLADGQRLSGRRSPVHPRVRRPAPTGR